MLGHLRVSNIGLLSDVALDPSPGYTVITGETGAGKTLLLGGVRLLVGEKSSPGAVGRTADSAQVDGQFILDGLEVGVTRIVPKDGRSRSYIDGTLVSAEALATTAGEFVEIVGQHDQLALARPSKVLAMVDGALDRPGRASADAYQEAWATLQDLLRRAAELGDDQMGLGRELDLVRYQSEEIERAALSDSEDYEAESLASRLRNTEELREHVGRSNEIVESLSDQFGEVVELIRKAAQLAPEIDHLVVTTEGLGAELGELLSTLRSGMDLFEPDPKQLAAIEERLTLIGELKRKYGRTIEEIHAFGQKASSRADELEGLLEAAERIESDLAEARRGVLSAGAKLSESRRAAAKSLTKTARRHLSDVGLSEADVEIRFESKEPGPGGTDKLDFFFRSDGNVEAGPIGSVASGGELSRLVLALRLAASTKSTATLVFDEIDTGIGGATAIAMGRKLTMLAKRSQVLCVTHLPQVAAHADAHYVLRRGKTETQLVRVEGEDRVKEIARMLAGLPDSEAGAAAAEELLEMAAK